MKQLALVLLCCTLLAGCRTWDRRDTPWDPRSGEALFDQIPNEDHGAARRCGGHLDPEVARREGRSMRC